ncbi:MAG: chorismate synthase [Gammaproteobacteria bacterium]|nr:chorismate synthase [Gammaproteobacteria bacterium]MCH9715855.1 chorismate synthase [Gammaproteobacteria bacterium]MCH9763353.1 chorismate synthase [Gammaproteobacteria bacterium]
MASNTFGTLFKITTWGESHGKAIGVVIDGCPAGIEVSNHDINLALEKRAPGRSLYTSPRAEPDKAEIYSGVFEGKTTGAPISIIILNHDSDSSKYEPIKHLLRPGHANYTYTKKYGVFDYRGGGRASARETACRVAAGAVAQKMLDASNIQVLSYIKSIAAINIDHARVDTDAINQNTYNSPIFCPDAVAESQMIQAMDAAQTTGDSLGGIVEFLMLNMPGGLGDPIYEKLEANLAKAMMSLPATKGFEIGEGFHAARMQGSEHNDEFKNNTHNPTNTNHAGGTLGGISTGMPLIGRVAFKPTSSIKKEQNTVDYQGQSQIFKLPEGSRHDPCVAIRAVPVVSAMCSIVLADAVLLNRCANIEA